jgi:hypothetical protein
VSFAGWIGLAGTGGGGAGRAIDAGGEGFLAAAAAFGLALDRRLTAFLADVARPAAFFLGAVFLAPVSAGLTALGGALAVFFLAVFGLGFAAFLLAGAACFGAFFACRAIGSITVRESARGPLESLRPSYTSHTLIDSSCGGVDLNERYTKSGNMKQASYFRVI